MVGTGPTTYARVGSPDNPGEHVENALAFLGASRATGTTAGVGSPRSAGRCNTIRPLWISVDPKPGGPTSHGRRRAESLTSAVGFDTDVNGAALAEGGWGRRKGPASFVHHHRNGIGAARLTVG